MALGTCAEGFVRLFAVFLSFLWNHWDWAISIFFVLWLVFFIMGKFGLGIVQTALVLLVIFFVFFFATAYLTDAPLCAFANELSQLLV